VEYLSAQASRHGLDHTCKAVTLFRVLWYPLSSPADVRCDEFQWNFLAEDLRRISFIVENSGNGIDVHERGFTCLGSLNNQPADTPSPDACASA